MVTNRCMIGEWMVRISKIIGKKVRTSDSFLVGKVTDAMLDADSWQITYVDITLSNEAIAKLKFKKPFMGYIGVCLPINLVSKFDEELTLTKTLEELKVLPQCRHV
jgi:sporulation protein YlmC with PRC-barrel domain